MLMLLWVGKIRSLAAPAGVRAAAPGSRRADWRLALALLCLFTASLQSLLSGAHLHRHFVDRPPEARGLAQLPDGDSTICALCQALLEGHAPPPMPVLWGARTGPLFQCLSFLVIARAHLASSSHHWRPRGPPKHSRRPLRDS